MKLKPYRNKLGLHQSPPSPPCPARPPRFPGGDELLEDVLDWEDADEKLNHELRYHYEHRDAANN